MQCVGDKNRWVRGRGRVTRGRRRLALNQQPFQELSISVIQTTASPSPSPSPSPRSCLRLPDYTLIDINEKLELLLNISKHVLTKSQFQINSKQSIFRGKSSKSLRQSVLSDILGWSGKSRGVKLGLVDII